MQFTLQQQLHNVIHPRKVFKTRNFNISDFLSANYTLTIQKFTALSYKTAAKRGFL